METHDIIVIGSSAGGVNALKELVKSFPYGFKASVFIVQHVAPDSMSFLPEILSNAGPLRAVHPANGDLIEKGKIYVAAPDHHLILENGRVLVRKGPKENSFRPSIDVCMRSAAYWYSGRTIGVVLTGRLSDGTSGLWSIRESGGITIVQDPVDADFPDMPNSVLASVEVDHVMPLSEMGALIVNLADEPAQGSTQPSDIGPSGMKERLELEIAIAAQQNAFENGVMKMGEKTNLTCPECGGSLISLQEGKAKRYRCHTGHGYSEESLWAAISENIEIKLWQAVRSMEEGIILAEQAVTQHHTFNGNGGSTMIEQKAAELKAKSKILLDMIYD